jgi:hypothetical protein
LGCLRKLGVEACHPCTSLLHLLQKVSTIAKALRIALQAELGRSARVKLWSRKFEYGETAIEAQETISNEADFAVVVMRKGSSKPCSILLRRVSAIW